MKTRKLTGGYAGYRAACGEAYRVNMHNPGLVYSDGDGFTVHSTLIPRNDDEYCLGEAVYCLNSGGNRNFAGTRREYEVERAAILAWLDARDRGLSNQQCGRAADDARALMECPD